MKGGGSFTNPPKRITVPSGGESSGDPYIIIAGDSDQFGNNYAAIIFRTPTLPPTWEYRIQIREGTPPYEAQFEVVLWDTATDDKVSRLVTSNYDSSADNIDTVIGPKYDDPQHGQRTYVWAHDYLELMTQMAASPPSAAAIQLRSRNIYLDGQTVPTSSNLINVNIGDTNVTDPPRITVHNKELGFSHVNVNQTPPPATTTTSGTFVLVAGATTAQFIKQYTSTDTHLTMGIGMFATAGGTVFQYGLRVTPNPYTGAGSLDFTLGQGLLSLSNVELAPSVTFTDPNKWLRDTYTLAPIWKRTVGAGTLTIAATGSTLSYTAQELKES